MLRSLIPLTVTLAFAAGCASAGESALRRDVADARDRLHLEGEVPALVDAREVDDYVTYALRVQPELRAAWERWRAASLRVSRPRRLPEPQVMVGVFARSVETRVGPQRLRVSARQSFPWPTKLTAGADAAERRARAAEQRLLAVALAIRARVEEAYFRLWTVRAIRQVRWEQAIILEELSTTVRARLETGAATLAELQQVDVARARLDDSIDGLSEQERAAAAALVAAAGAPPGSPVETAPEPPPLFALREDEAALARAAAAHPAVEALALMAAGSASEAASQRADGLPGLTLGLDWIETGEARMPGPDSGTDPLIVSVGMSVPLWRGSYREAEEAALADAEAFRADRRAAVDAAIERLESALSAVRDSRRRVELHRDTLIPQGVSTYESVIGAYAVGRGGIAALLLAQRDLLELREMLAVTRAAHATAWARLDAVVGRAAEREPVPEPPPVLTPAPEGDTDDE